MKRIDFLTSPSGFPLNADTTFHFMQQSYTEAVRAIAALAGDTNVIVQGCLRAGTGVTPGWLWLGGELVAFEGGDAGATDLVELVETSTSDTNENSQEVPRYFTKTAKFSVNGTVRFGSIARAGTMLQLQRWAASVVQFEPCVIVQGCEVSNVSGLSRGTLSVSPGTIVVDGKFVRAEAYSGTFPVYLDAAGQWSRAVPAGQSIAFDPYTSQRAEDVLARATAKKGEIRDVATYDVAWGQNGLGKWKWKGWALADGRNGTMDLQGRVRVGRQADHDEYDRIGRNGGKEEVTLRESEMPPHRHGSGPGDEPAQGGFGLIRRSRSGEDNTLSTSDVGGSGVEPDLHTTPKALEPSGGGEPHENRMPFSVVLTIQRI